MKLTTLRLSGFQSFGPTPTTITFEKMTYLLGPNGSGKTAVLQALARLFGFDPSQRRIRRADFNIPLTGKAPVPNEPLRLWIEADFEFPELKGKGKTKQPTIPMHFAHMQLVSAGGLPRVRFRLSATLDEDGDLEEQLEYVIETDANEVPTKLKPVDKSGRNSIQVHYLPARRDPSDHIAYTANSLLGRTIRAANWSAERETVAKLTGSISSALASNAGIAGIGAKLAGQWKGLHKGVYYASPSLSFEANEIESLLRHLTIGFTPGPGEEHVDFSRLSDGQQSLLYLSLVLAVQGIGREALAGKLPAFDLDKLRPAVFTFLAMEEPENSLSPHYLGRVVNALSEFSQDNDTQAVVATHAPSLLRRVEPESIRYLRLDANRNTQSTLIQMPPKGEDAYKFVREGVQAYPELYFSRLVILGEGDSEEIVLPRILQAHGLTADDAAVSIAPLGGRHVNHFWRLLHGLGIPYVTLLDLDFGRYQGGWGRVKYVAQQLLKFPTSGSTLNDSFVANLAEWNGSDNIVSSDNGKSWMEFLDSQNVFFSTPLDLDFSMMTAFQGAYGVDGANLAQPDQSAIQAVLGKKHSPIIQYDVKQLEFFGAYHRSFKLGSKPAAHLEALAALDSDSISKNVPASYARMVVRIKEMLDKWPE